MTLSPPPKHIAEILAQARIRAAEMERAKEAAVERALYDLKMRTQSLRPSDRPERKKTAAQGQQTVTPNLNVPATTPPANSGNLKPSAKSYNIDELKKFHNTIDSGTKQVMKNAGCLKGTGVMMDNKVQQYQMRQYQLQLFSYKENLAELRARGLLPIDQYPRFEHEPDPITQPWEWEVAILMRFIRTRMGVVDPQLVEYFEQKRWKTLSRGISGSQHADWFR